MDRELLLEIGCEELPASWLPGLTNQVGEVLSRQLREHRLPPEAPAETFSTPRRLTVRVARVPERQTDLEELVNGPPVAASFAADGTPTPAAAGFAAKQGVEISALERVTTAKGEYIAFRRRQRGKTTVDVLPGVLAGALRSLTFPKSQQRQSGARASVEVTDVSNFGAPHFWAKHCSTDLKVGKRFRGSALGEPEPCTGGRDQDRADTRRPALLRQKGEQRFRLTQVARLDRDISQNSYGEREPRSKITLAQHL